MYVKNQAWFLDFCYSYEIICKICFQQCFSIDDVSSDITGFMKLLSFGLSDFCSAWHMPYEVRWRRREEIFNLVQQLCSLGVLIEKMLGLNSAALLRMGSGVADVYFGISILRTAFDYHTLFLSFFSPPCQLRCCASVMCQQCTLLHCRETVRLKQRCIRSHVSYYLALTGLLCPFINGLVGLLMSISSFYCKYLLKM